MTARVERYYQWVLILCIVLMCVGFGSLAAIGFLRSAAATEVAALARTEGRISNVVVAAYGFDPIDASTATRLSAAILDLEAAVGILNGTTSADDVGGSALEESLGQLTELATTLQSAAGVTPHQGMVDGLSATAEAMVEQAKERRLALEDRLNTLTSAFIVTLVVAGLSLAGVVYLVALLFSAIRSNLRWNSLVLDSLDRGEAAVSSSHLRVNRFFPGAGQMAIQTAELSSRMADLVSEKADLSESLQRNVDELRASREEFARSAQLAAIGKLAGSVSHEINNPVTGIMGYIAYARKHVDDPTVLMYLAKAAREIERIGRIAKSLLVFSRHNARNEPLRFDVMLALDNVVTLAKPQMDDASVRIDVESEGVATDALGHIDAFQQALLNLLLNARYALLECEHRVITIVVAYGLESIEVQVRDTGAGVPMAARGSLFEPFFTTKPAGEGSGLGLAVTREVMQRMGGNSDFDGTYGPGARFVLTVPVAQGAKVAAASPSTPIQVG
jgi:signal transduction histidine kinase